MTPRTITTMARRRSSDHPRPQGFSALENGWHGPSLQEQVVHRGQALIAKGQIEKAKGIAIALAILRSSSSRSQWELLNGEGVDG